METTEIIQILAKLAKSEGLYVETPCDNETENPDWSDRMRGGGRSELECCKLNDTSGGRPLALPCSMLSESAIGTGSAGPVGRSGSLWSAVGGFAWNAASSLWRSVAGNYAVTASIQLVPVHDLVLNFQDPQRERLADKIRKIMKEHSVLNVNSLVDKIQEDSSLVRKIILKYLYEYLAEDMSLNVVVSAKDDSDSS